MKIIRIMNEIIIQNEKYIKNNMIIKLANMNNKRDLLTNSGKLLYIRKVANILLNELYNKYKNKIEDIEFKY
jgi:hypothetical protein